MKTNIRKTTKSILLLMLTLLMLAFSQSKSGLEIAQNSDKASNGWKTKSSNMTMTMTNKNGQKAVRKMHSYSMEVKGDGDKTFTVFDTPADVKGTVSMIYSHKIGEDDQWLYLPAIKRVKRISSSTKSGPFMGSEFAFEDISSLEIDKFTYKAIDEGKANGVECYKVVRYPKSKSSGYKKNIVWYNTKNYRIEKVEYYDRKDALLKTLTHSGYKRYLDNYWFAHQLKMVNNQNGKETLLEFDNVKFGIPLTDDDFSQNALKRSK